MFGGPCAVRRFFEDEALKFCQKFLGRKTSGLAKTSVQKAIDWREPDESKISEIDVKLGLGVGCKPDRTQSRARVCLDKTCAGPHHQARVR